MGLGDCSAEWHLNIRKHSLGWERKNNSSLHCGAIHES